MAKLSGGGIQSSKRVEVGVRTGSPANKVSPGGVSQLGTAIGDKPRSGGGHTGQNTAVPVFSGQKPQAAALGNAKALDVQGGGPGKGRTVYRTGTQSQYGDVAGSPKPQGREILGPDRRRP
jgi:hypothetical protein